MDEERIFGPFTLRQSIYLAAGIFLIYLIYQNLYSKSYSIPLVVLIIIAVGIMIKKHSPKPIDQEYIRRKRTELGREKFQSWARMKVAMLHAQISIRQEKGLPDDRSLIEMKDLFEKIMKEN